MFVIGDKVIVDGQQAIGVAFQGLENTNFIVAEARLRNGDDRQQIRLRIEGHHELFVSDGGLRWFAATRFKLGEHQVAAPAAPKKVVDRDGVELKVGDAVATRKSKGLASYIVIDIKVEKGVSRIRLESPTVYIPFVADYQRILNDDPDADINQVYAYKSMSDCGWYSSEDQFYKRDRSDGMKGDYFILGDCLFMAYTVYDHAEGLNKFQCVGYLQNDMLVRQYEIGQFYNFNIVADHLVPLLVEDRETISKNIANNVYGTKPEGPKAPEPMDEEKLNKQMREVLAANMKDAQNPALFDGGPSDFTVFNHYNNKIYHKCKFGEACHYDLKKQGYTNIYSKSRPFAVVQYLNRIEHKLKDNALEAARAGVSWIIRKSPWKDAFIRTTYQKALKEGLFVNIDRSGNEIGSALIAIRQFTEFPNSAETFAKLRELNLPVESAWLFLFGLGCNVKGEFTLGGLGDRGHTMIYSGTPIADIAKFFKTGLPAEVNEKRTYRNYQGYDHIYGVVSENINQYGDVRRPNGETLKDFFLRSIKSVTVGKGFDQKQVIDTDSLKAASQEFMNMIKAA